MSGGNPYQWQQGPQPPQPGNYPPQPQYPPQPAQYGQPGGYQPYGSAQVPPGQPAQGDVNNLPPEAFGGFWIRLVALLLDWLILFIPLSLITSGIYLAFGYPPMAQFDFTTATLRSQDLQYQMANNVSTLVSILVNWMYFALMHANKGATLGKLALGLRVVDQSGMHVGFGRATGRYFATLLSACLCLVGFIIAGFHAQKRSLHDLIAGTWVVRKEYVNPQQQVMQ